MNAPVKKLWTRGLSAKSLRLCSKSNKISSGFDCAFGDLYKVQRYITSGSFGKVFEATHISTDTRVIIKIVQPNEWYTQVFDTVDDVYNEVLGWSDQRAQTVVKYFDALQFGNFYAVCMEPLDGPEFAERIEIERASRQDFHKFIQKSMQDMLAGLVYVHERELIHRDIKLESFKYRSNAANSSLVLFDLGLCCRSQSSIPRGPITGSLRYLAPEMVYTGNYDCKVDVWAVGVCLYVLMNGTFPWIPSEGILDSNIKDRFLKERDLKLLLNGNSRTITFLKQLLCFDPEYRLSALEAYRIATDSRTWN